MSGIHVSLQSYPYSGSTEYKVVVARPLPSWRRRPHFSPIGVNAIWGVGDNVLWIGVNISDFSFWLEIGYSVVSEERSVLWRVINRIIISLDYKDKSNTIKQAKTKLQLISKCETYLWWNTMHVFQNDKIIRMYTRYHLCGLIFRMLLHGQHFEIHAMYLQMHQLVS